MNKKKLLISLVALFLVFVMTSQIAGPLYTSLASLEGGVFNRGEERDLIQRHELEDRSFEEYISPSNLVLEEDIDMTAIIAEDVSKRTETSRTWIQGDGVRVFQDYGVPIHFFDGTEYREIDNTINRDLTNIANSFNVQFGQAEDDFLVRVGRSETGTVSMRPVFENRVVMQPEVTVSNKLDSSVCMNNLNFSSDELRTNVQESMTSRSSSVYFTNVFQDIDFKYILEGTSLKEYIILHTPQDCYLFTFEMTLDGLSARMVYGEIQLVNRRGELRYVIPRGYMRDSADVYSFNVDYFLKRVEPGSYLLTVAPDPTFFDGATFPVFIDPTIQAPNRTTPPMVLGNHNRSNSTWSNTFTVSNTQDAFINLNTNSVNNIVSNNIVLSAEVSVVGAVAVLPPSFRVMVRQSHNPSRLFNSPILFDNVSHTITNTFPSRAVRMELSPYLSNLLADSMITVRLQSGIFGAQPGLTSLTIRYTRRSTGYYLTQDLGNRGMTSIDLLTGRLTYMYNSVNINDGFMPLIVNHVYNEAFTGNHRVGTGFRLNLHQRIRRHSHSDGEFFTYTDAVGKIHYFCARTMFNPELGLRLWLRDHAGQAHFYFLVDRSGNSMVFSFHGHLLEMHQFPSTFHNRISGMYLQINYVNQPADRRQVNTYQISNVTNGNTTVNFNYGAHGYLNSLTKDDMTLISFEYHQAGTRFLDKVVKDTHTVHLGYYTGLRLRQISETNINTRHYTIYSFNSHRVAAINHHIRDGNSMRPDSQSIVNISYAETSSNSSDVRQTTILSKNNHYFRHVSFDNQNNVIADYAFEVCNTCGHFTPLSAFSNGFNYDAFVNAFGNTREIEMNHLSARHFEIINSRDEVSTYVFSAWFRSSNLLLSLFRYENRLIHIRSIQQSSLPSTLWQYVTLSFDPSEFDADTFEILVNSTDVQYARLFSVPRQDPDICLRPRFHPNGQLYSTRQMNPDGTVSVFTHEYGPIQAATAQRPEYPGQIRSITERINGVQQSRIVYEYTNQMLTTIRVYGRTGTPMTMQQSFLPDGRINYTIDENGVKTYFHYNYDGSFTTEIVGEQNITTTSTFESTTGLLTSRTTGSLTTHFGYNSRGMLGSITHNGFNSTFTYHEDGRLHRIGVAGRTLATYTYSRNQDRITWGNNQLVNYNYDNRGLLTSMTGSSGNIATFLYDNHRNLTQINNASGTVYEFFTPQGFSEGFSVTNGENTVTRKTRLEHSPLGNSVVNEFLWNGELMDSNTTHFTPRGQVCVVQTPHGITSHSYDNLHRLTHRLRNVNSLQFTDAFRYLDNTGLVSWQGFSVNASSRSQLTYTYWPNGFLQSIHCRETNITHWFEYDEYGRLVREIMFEGTQKDTHAIIGFEFEYDEGGNLVRNGHLLYEYCNVWRDLLISFDGMPIEYDEIGNPTYYMGKEMTWQNGRQLASVTLTDHTWWSPGTLVEFSYDYAGIRTSKTRNYNTTYYFMDGSRMMARILGCCSYDTQWFFHDDAGIYGFTLGGQKYIFERNILGDVYAIYNASTGQWVGRYFYRAYGELLGMHVNPDYPGATAVMNLNPIRWRGKYYDIDLGFYYMNSRWYDPQTGRFINSDDPVMLLSEPFLAPASGTNLFMYAYNNAVMFRDDSGYGLLTKLAIIGIATLVVAGGTTGGVMAAQNDECVWSGIGMGMVSGGMVACGVILGLAGHPHIGAMLVGAGFDSMFSAHRNMQAGGSMFAGWMGGMVSGGLSGLSATVPVPPVAFLGGFTGNMFGGALTNAIDGRPTNWNQLAAQSALIGVFNQIGSFAGFGIGRLSGNIPNGRFIGGVLGAMSDYSLNAIVHVLTKVPPSRISPVSRLFM